MINASIIFIPIPVTRSPEPLRRMRPAYPAKPRNAQWPLAQPIPRFVPPADQIEAIKRAGKAVLDMVRSQRGG